MMCVAGSWDAAAVEVCEQQPVSKVRCLRMQNRGRIMHTACHTGVETKEAAWQNCDQQIVAELAATQREQAVMSHHQQKELWDWIKHGTQRIVILAALIRSCLPLPPPPPAFPGSGRVGGVQTNPAPMI